MTLHASMAPVRSARIYVFRAPIARAVRTSFGTMPDRPAVLVRLEDEDGRHGWGEAWCNFPSCGAEHRARLLESVIVPLILGRAWEKPADLSLAAERRLEVLRLQTDEPGPLAQALAALDTALWDLAARRAGLPLHRFLGGQGDGGMPVYASGINHPDIAGTIRRMRARGFRCFKIKIGFDGKTDAENLAAAARALLPGESLAVDANQAWSLDEALDRMTLLRGQPLLWIEEPLRCDSPEEHWALLARKAPAPLAAGENIRSEAGFAAAIAARHLGVIQPDLCKWGGLSRCLPVAKAVLAAGLRYCPHYLGGGIGLLASAHLLAAAGGDGLLEVDCNENPLRALLAVPFPEIRDGRLRLSEAPGLGVEPDLESVMPFVSWKAECR